MRNLLVVLLLGACSDYNLSDQPEAEQAADPDPDAPPEVEEEEEEVEDDDPDPDPDPDPVDPPASEPVYAHSPTALYRVDLSNGDAEYIGTFHDDDGGIDEVVDLAIDLNGQMYAGTWDSLYQVDPTTGYSTWICDPGVGMVGLTFTATGRLVASGGNEVHFIDVNTCATFPLVTNSSWFNSGDIVGLPDGYLYWSVAGSTDDGLVRIDPNTGEEHFVGQTTGAEGLWGLGYHDNLLWGFAVSGHIVTIDPATAAATWVTQTPGVEWWGAATNPVLW